MDSFRATLRRHREALRWSQERLAYAAQMDHSLVSRIESGQRNPTRDAIAKLCTALELPESACDRLYLLAGFTPPDLDMGALAGLVEIVRANEAHTLAAALHLAREARRLAADAITTPRAA